MKNVALFVTKEVGHQYSHIKCRIVKKTDKNTIENFIRSYDDKDTEFFKDLFCSCQMGGFDRSYGYQLYYSDVYSVMIGDSEKMHKTLKSLERKLEKMYDVRGSASTFAEYAGRIAEALKAEFVFTDGPSHDFYDRMNFKFMSISDGIIEIGRIEQELVSKHN